MAELLLGEYSCLGQYVTIQDEVAERLLANPGTSAWGPLGILVQSRGDVRRLATLGPGCFWPPPKVTSAMITIEPRDHQFAGDVRAFAAFVTKLYSTRRKQLGGVLGEACVRAAGIDPRERCERLDIPSLERLFFSSQSIESHDN
jgi:16S rRNA (adenine1518-N6/adenine1519-N6)-dimethyltransferase